jgi:hypothetical protein
VPDAPDIDRRRYRRVQAPILVRPAGVLAQMSIQRVSDISLGGIRTFSDVDLPRGRRLEIELLFQDETSSTVLVEVAWVERLGAGAPAPFEMGLRIVDAGREDLERIGRALGD